MSDFLSPLKSPTVANWYAATEPHCCGIGVPEAGFVVTHQAPVSVCVAMSVRLSPSKSPETEFTHVVPAGRDASVAVVKELPVDRLTAISSPAMPRIEFGFEAGSGVA